ncbi:hypothetical protein F1188_16250 [Roseospira marina]|uniref:Uncharacterized protein n=1 Tax=Roseospira marina TaxID=140057 RepID=A0A5M6I897_9PROT|nr:hypothetical protein [Roseospira marina]KAA5604411.1 hypothetical protein F1188_16250 [Roseospira marina]MBB4315397.1 hypothetical protein [Roseospira marina]MBB5088458.1 hypothetical protein [Roseospira marina]
MTDACGAAPYDTWRQPKPDVDTTNCPQVWLKRSDDGDAVFVGHVNLSINNLARVVSLPLMMYEDDAVGLGADSFGPRYRTIDLPVGRLDRVIPNAELRHSLHIKDEHNIPAYAIEHQDVYRDATCFSWPALSATLEQYEDLFDLDLFVPGGR